MSSKKVPLNWQRLWCGPLTTLDYIKAFMHRAIATEARYRTMPHLEFIDEIDLSTVYNCQTLLSALKLINSHKLNVSCKNLVLESRSLGADKTTHNHNANQLQLKLKPLQVSKLAFFLFIP